MSSNLQTPYARLADLESLFRGTPLPILITDCEGGVIDANPAAASFLGYTVAELTGHMSLSSLFEGDVDRELVEPLCSSVGASAEKLGALVITKNRSRIPVSVAAHCFASGEGGLKLAHILHDMRRLTEMEAKLEEAQIQLIHADKMASLGKLAAGVAHEMNNPLGGILLFGGLLLEDLEPGDPRHDTVARILHETRRCSETVSSLLDFAHQRQRYREEVNLEAAILQCLTLLGGKAGFHNIKVEADYGVGIPSVTGNPSQIKQVFTNIIANAVDAMGGEGTLYIELTHNPIREEVSAAFRDTGPGIPASALARVFDPFFTTKEAGKGTGLGLSLSYNLVKMHHGEIRAANAQEGGAVMTVVLPVRGGESGQ